MSLIGMVETPPEVQRHRDHIRGLEEAAGVPLAQIPGKVQEWKARLARMEAELADINAQLAAREKSQIVE
jgi:hypothetical protein